MGTDVIRVRGAREHNLQNINVDIPRNSLVTVTGLSGSGKSSLVFDTIYAEGQRRYIETFSIYSRNFLQQLERPDVDEIDGLSPVISIEQKTTNRNPRSTVGTLTEIYDFLRLLYARVSTAYSYVTGEEMTQYTEEQVIALLYKDFEGEQVYVTAPLVVNRKGHYRELFEQYRRKGFLYVMIDGEFTELVSGLMTSRTQVHHIELVVDRLRVDESSRKRLSESIEKSMYIGNGSLSIIKKGETKGYHYSKNLVCPVSGISYATPHPHTFSFNSPHGACERCSGLGRVMELSYDRVIPNPNLSIRLGGIAPLGVLKSERPIFKQIELLGKKFDFTLDTPIKDIVKDAIDIILYGSGGVMQIPLKLVGSSTELFFEGLDTIIRDQMSNSSKRGKRWAMTFLEDIVCPECNGQKLKKEALHFKVGEKSISELANMSIGVLYEWIGELDGFMDDRVRLIAHEVIKEVRTRLGFLVEVGLSYLALDRSMSTLSGGESQRIRLATQIGSQLVNVLYVLDEPSIGLHQSDNRKLIASLKSLRDIGNSIIVVEHDREMMEAADYVIDIGPKAGVHGGKVVSAGTYDELLLERTETVDYLTGVKRITVPKHRRKRKQWLTLNGAKGNNLKGEGVSFPLGVFVCVTGVSGSGKSTLIIDTLEPILNQHFYNSVKAPLPYDSIKGLEYIDKVVKVDQSPIGRTPRSNPATYTKVFDIIRRLFADLPESKIRGYSASRFSFNTSGGRCEECQGAGVKCIEMGVLPDVFVDCDKCEGRRYNRETLEVRYKGRSISDVLNMTIEQAVHFFSNIPAIVRKLETLRVIGLGYIQLGQSSTSLSGGESQRVKLAAELSKRDTGSTFYILDEPTTGLHFEDIKVLLSVLDQLVEKGNTVLVIEHNMDVIKMADYVIDLGKGGGANGGRILCKGTPEEVMVNKESLTAPFLRREIMGVE